MELTAKPALARSAPSFRLSFYAESPAPQQHLLQVLLTLVVFHDALSLPTPEQLLQVGPHPIYLRINHPLPAPGPGPPTPTPQRPTTPPPRAQGRAHSRCCFYELTPKDPGFQVFVTLL